MASALNPLAREFVPSSLASAKPSSSPPSFKAALLKPSPDETQHPSSQALTLPQGWEICSIEISQEPISSPSIDTSPVITDRPTSKRPTLKLTSPDPSALVKHQARWFEIAADSRKLHAINENESLPTHPSANDVTSIGWHNVLHSSSVAKEQAWLRNRLESDMHVHSVPKSKARTGTLREYVQALSSGDVAKIQMMKHEGWDLHAKIDHDENGGYPIHLVVLSKNALALQFLIDCGVDVNVRDKQLKRTPLHYAIEAQAVEVRRSWPYLT